MSFWIQKKIWNIEPCKILNNYEEVKNYIQNNKSFEIVSEQFINSIDPIFKNNAQLSMKIFYIGLHKLIICFKEGANLKYLLILISGNQKKYYEFLINDESLFRKLLKKENDIIFKKNSIFKNIRFISLDNSNSATYSQMPKNSFNIGNNYIYNNNFSNQQNQSVNNNFQNDIPEEENNINIKKKNEDNNFPKNANSSTNKAKEMNIGKNITNNKNNINDNMNKIHNNSIDNRINREKKEEEEKKNYYENEKQRLLLQKKINESLLLDLDKANLLPKLRKSKAKVEEDIKKTKNDLENIEAVTKRLKKEIEISSPKKIVKEESINGRAQRRHKSYKSQIRQEQMQKREELDYNYRILKLKDKIKDLEKKKYIKQLYEEKLKQRENDLLEINEKIRQQYEYEKDFNKKQEFIRVMLEQNEEELEKLNKINNYEEELKKVQKEIKEKEKRKREEEMIKAEQEREEKERKEREELYRRQKEEELNRIKYMDEEELNKEKESKQFEEENRIKMLEEEQRKKQEDYLETIRKQQKESEEQVRKQNELAKILRLEEQLNTQREEEKRKKEEEEKRRQKELEELEKQNRIKIEKERKLEEQKRKKKEFEDQSKSQEEQRRIQEELERKKRELEEQKLKQKEFEEQQRKMQKELEEQQRKQKEFEEQQIKMQKELEEQQRKQKELEEQQKIQNKLLLEKQKEINDTKENAKIITCKSFEKPPLIGLENIGSTCYMNATLQCFSQTEVLTNYFLNKKNINKIMNNNVAKKDPNDLQLSPSYHNLILNLWSDKPNKWFSPKEFRIKLANMNPLFKEGLPNDAKDLVTYILMQLHSELNLKDGNKNSNINIDYNLQSQYNEQVTLNNFIQSFFSENSSILSDHFFGVQESKFLCTGCQKRAMGKGITPIKYNFQTFNFLIFPLEEVRIHRNKKLMNKNPFNMNNPMNMNNQFNMNNMNNPMNINQNQVTIYDCFDYFQKEEFFTGENAMWCNDCNAQLPSKNQTFIYTGPNILIIILNRGVGIQFKIKLNYYESIDLNKYILQKDRVSMIYDLYGVVTHIGESGGGGHFIASCKSPCNNQWYRYNDALVNQIMNVQKEVIDFGNSYILFYQKR